RPVITQDGFARSLEITGQGTHPNAANSYEVEVLILIYIHTFRVLNISSTICTVASGFLKAFIFLLISVRSSGFSHISRSVVQKSWFISLSFTILAAFTATKLSAFFV